MAMFDKHKSTKQTTPQTSEPTVRQQAPSMGSSPSGSPSKVAMIGNGIVITGDVTADTDLRVEGLIQGRSIESTMDVEVGEAGRVQANITARVVKIGGEVNGDIFGSEKVVITRTGRVQGNVLAPRVQLEDGSLFRGSIEMNPVPAATKTKAPASESKAATAKPAPAKGAAAASAGARKEPGLTLKSG